MTNRDDKVAVELGDRGSIFGEDETGRTNGNKRRRRGERESGGEGTKGWGSTMTTKGGKPSGGDASTRFRESEGGEKKGESSWKVTLA